MASGEGGSGSSSASSASARAVEGKDEVMDIPALDPALFVVCHAVSKKMNIGMIVRSAGALGARAVVICTKGDVAKFGSRGVESVCPVLKFESVSEATMWLRGRGCQLVGVEITPDSRSITESPWAGPTALLMGNEGTGLTPELREVADSFVYIPQHSPAVASLNVAVAASIVMHNFATWAKYPECKRSEEHEEKFAVTRIREGRQHTPTPGDLLVREVRALKRARPKETTTATETTE